MMTINIFCRFYVQKKEKTKNRTSLLKKIVEMLEETESFALMHLMDIITKITEVTTQLNDKRFMSEMHVKITF